LQYRGFLLISSNGKEVVKAKNNDKGKLINRQIVNLLKCGLNIVGRCISSENEKASKLDVLYNQIFDSIIVGAIAGISTYVSGGEHVSVVSALLGFSLTFLIKMKEYRNIQ
jgi:hypothetical protein